MTDTSPTAAAPPVSAGDDGFVPLRVVDVIDDTDDSVVVRFDTVGTSMPFGHGQHLTLRRAFDGVEVRRSYSICAPAPDGLLQVAIKHVPGGAFSSWACSELRPGDTIDVLPPSGHFTHDLDPAAARRYTLFAAGSGITPILSVAATVLAVEPDSTVDLLYVNRSATTTMLLDELHDLRDRALGRFRLTFAFTREASGGELLSGRPGRERIDRLIETDLLPANADHAFLCGPIELIEEVESALIDAGSTATIHREIFTTPQTGRVSMAPQEITTTSVSVARGTATLHGRTSTFEVYEGDSVLDAVQRIRPDAPYSCRSGVCSTCQAVLRDGDVEMAVNYGLTDDEVERGYVLTCQSTPTTGEITVDYDA